MDEKEVPFTIVSKPKDTSNNIIDTILHALTNPQSTYEPARQLNHIGYTERFIANFQGKVLYVPNIGWHIYRDNVWQLDQLNDVLALTAIIPCEIQTEFANGTLGDINPQSLHRAIAQASSETTRQAILRLAAADTRIKIPVTKLNHNPLLLAVKNGTLDLVTKTLNDSRPDDFITQQANVKFNPEATCPRFDALLHHAFNGDINMITYIWRSLGYCLTGLSDEQVFFFLWGVRGSGKTTIAEIMTNILGTYAQTLDEAALTGGAEQHPTWIVDLLGKRLVVKDELDHRRRLNTARLNALTGGSTQRGRRMRNDFVDIPITAKFMITTNHCPPMGNGQDGIWRRIQPWHFTVPIDDQYRVKNYTKLLVNDEGPGILNKCLDGLSDYLNVNNPAGGNRDLRSPRVVIDSAEAYRELEDDQSPFIVDILTQTNDERDWVANPDIQAVYRDWCDQNNVKPLPGVSLSKLLIASGFKPATARKARHKMSGRIQTQRGFVGIKVNIVSCHWVDLIAWSSLS